MDPCWGPIPLYVAIPDSYIKWYGAPRVHRDAIENSANMTTMM